MLWFFIRTFLLITHRAEKVFAKGMFRSFKVFAYEYENSSFDAERKRWLILPTSMIFNLRSILYLLLNVIYRQIWSQVDWFNTLCSLDIFLYSIELPRGKSAYGHNYIFLKKIAENRWRKPKSLLKKAKATGKYQNERKKQKISHFYHLNA